MIHSLNTNPAHSSGDASDVAPRAEYEIETYKAGHWFWVVRDQAGILQEFGTFCGTRRKARKKAMEWIDDQNLREGKSKEEIRFAKIKAKTKRKETYGG